MLDQLVPGIIFASLSSIGIWHSIPLTGVTPSNSFFWRSLSSLEIAYSIHGLRQVHPFVFPYDDTISEYDLLLQLSLDAQHYENARLALEDSADALSLHYNTPGGITSMLVPGVLGATPMPASFYLNNGSYEEQQQLSSAQSNTLNFTVMTTLILAILTMQTIGFWMTNSIKQHVEDLHLQYDHIVRTSDMQAQFSILMIEIQKFRRENEQVRPVFVYLAEAITNSSADLQHCLLHVVGMMENKYTSGMIDIESKLDEIPRQLAWLNILMAKNISNSLPEGLDQPNLDFSKSLTPEQMNRASNYNTAEQPNGIPNFEGGLGLKNEKGGSFKPNSQELGLT
ncbi:hypothetical protein Pdw03_4338 [Penicillium digitatum]|uniref:Uncharacterized protein n=1 Tax=Penicillium digitatum TaxID=36651 RepID=A0A7T6XHZ8_PENDI|nr:hypothetical protein PDIDSM_6544 [Penicillium digitatum]QQK41484.1 hypothetical protein Pdw03_4338 [Penicillium digitatum]